MHGSAVGLLCLLFTFLLPIACFPITDTTDIETILAKHNTERDHFDLPPMLWDTNLANCASAWAEQCLVSGSLPSWRSDCAGVSFVTTGEAGSWAEDGTGNPNDFIFSFLDSERPLYWNAGGCEAAPYDNAYAHYIQIIWSETISVGCGQASCSDTGVGNPDAPIDLFFCHYGPASSSSVYLNSYSPLVADGLGNPLDRCTSGRTWFNGFASSTTGGAAATTGTVSTTGSSSGSVCGDGVRNGVEACDDGDTVTGSCDPAPGAIECVTCGSECTFVTNYYFSSLIATRLTLENDNPLVPITRIEPRQEVLTPAPLIVSGCAFVQGELELTLLSQIPTGTYELIRSEGSCLSGAFSSLSFDAQYDGGNCDTYSLIRWDSTDPNALSIQLSMEIEVDCDPIAINGEGGVSLPANWWWWLAIALGVAVLVVVVVVVVIFVKKKKQRDYDLGYNDPEPATAYQGSKSLTPASDGEYIPPPPTRTVPQPQFSRPKSIAPSGLSPMVQGSRGQLAYDFVAQTGGELSAAVGEMVEILNDSDPDWYMCRLNGAEGAIPKSYITKF